MFSFHPSLCLWCVVCRYHKILLRDTYESTTPWQHRVSSVPVVGDSSAEEPRMKVTASQATESSDHCCCMCPEVSKHVWCQHWASVAGAVLESPDVVEGVRRTGERLLPPSTTSCPFFFSLPAWQQGGPLSLFLPDALAL